MHTKAFACSVKAAGPDDGLGDGEYRALVSVYGNIDAYGDVVLPGAFADTLADWKASGDPIPVYWSHRLDDPDMNIGEVIDARETDRGLEIHARLDLDNPKARQAYRLLKGRRVTQHSFSYDILEAAPAERDGQQVYELRKLKLHEVGPTPIGANSATELLAVKAAGERVGRFAADLKTILVGMDIKAGRVLSGRNESTLREAQAALEAAVAQIQNVLSTTSTEGGSDDSTQPTTETGAADAPSSDDKDTAEAGDEPEPGGRSPASPGRSPGDVRMLAELELLDADLGSADPASPDGANHRGVGNHMVYLLYGAAGDLLYVGVTDRGTERIAEHARIEPWFGQVQRVEFEHYPTRDQSEQRERALIITHGPTYNVRYNRDA